MRKLRRFSERPREPVAVTVDPLPTADALRFLAEGEVVVCEPIAWGSNYSFAVVLRRDDEQRLAVYKPRRGEVPLWDFPDGTLYRREYAAFLVSQALGWDFIPPTVIRGGPYGIGTVQLYIDADPRADPSKLRQTNEGELMRMFLFDVFANNADRKSTHCLRDRQGKLWGIDHGLTFNVVTKLRTVIWDFCGEPIPRPVLDEMSAFLSDRARMDALNGQLAELLDPAEVAAFYARFERLLKLGRFPHLDPYRNVPRGWW
ncbi:MAG: SCO1664 family protein [Chloroflexi bacterium]|nr:SCO1664 family protein [Chloroflexota bacterium]